jgi:para-nitrobenzyl esterase
LGETGLNYTSEDCLTMNIFAPLAPVPGGAAVIVFFPAGGYTWGAANDGEMNAYGKSSAPGWQDVVFITVNYRVSIFGFLAHDSLRGRDPAGSTGCYGSQDQREALRWVQSNIAGFGGDPKRVTIFGESAGATSVTTHMVMEKSWGLFQRAMTDSGGFSDWVRSFEDASDVFENITAQLGCTDSKDRITCMVGQPTSMLLDVTDPYYGIVPKTGKPPVLPHPESVLGTQWAPVVDGVEIPKYPQQLLQEGKVAPGVPMLLGSNRDEGSLFREQTDYLA